ARALRGERVVGHHQRGLSVISHEAVQEIQDLVRALAVEVAGGLVAEQKRRIGHDRARDADALLLSAGVLSRIVLHPVAQPHERDEIARVDVEVESLKHMDLLAATPIGLAEPARADQALAVPATIDADHRFSLVGYFFTRTDWPSRNCLAPVATT